MGTEEEEICVACSVWVLSCDVMRAVDQTVVIPRDLRFHHMFPVWPPRAEWSVC